MDEWGKFNKTTLPEKEEFYSNLIMEYITDKDYMHAKRVCKDFEIKNFGDYHDFYLKSDILLLAECFRKHQKNVFKIYHSDVAKCFSAPGLAWKVALKKTEVKLELSTDIDVLLMVEKEIGGGICHVIHRYAKSYIKYMKYYEKNKDVLNIGM